MYQVKEMEDKIDKLRGGVTLVRPEDRKAVEDMYLEKLSHWRRRKRMFKDLWDAITENSPKDLKEFKVKILFIASTIRIAEVANSCINFCRRNSGLNMMKMLA